MYTPPASKPELVDLAVHQLSQRVKAMISSVASEPSKKTLPVRTEFPSNPRAALQLFLSLHSRQKERGQSVGEDYVRGIQIFKNLFIQYGHPELSNSLPELPQGIITSENNQTSMTAPGSSQQLPPDVLPVHRAETRMEDDQENLSIAMGPPTNP